ncbi:MAG TPA: phytanoyl-CoA dioxygenase family protein [Phototrophicaceae bacterium]|nr:phytanoyl-CoA dioxygenase family protein [Phototrophicaceae bacterium]
MLSRDQIDFYQENGYILLEGLFTPKEAAAYRQRGHDLIDGLAARKSVEATWDSARELVKEVKLLHCHDVQFYDAAFNKLLFDPRLVDSAAELMGTPNIQLHHNKMFIKPPEKGAPFPMHQDQPFFPHEKHTMTAAIIHFDDAPVEKGCVRVVPGSYKLGPLQHIESGGWHLPFSEYPLESSIPCAAKAGDVLVFNYLTIHGSGVNVSDEPRTTLLIQMRDPSDHPLTDVHRSPGQGTMLRGINTDEV